MLTSQDVVAAEFPTVKWRPGYEIDDVRTFLAAVGETLVAYETGAVAEMVTVRQVKNPPIYPTKFREGWGQAEVDRFLREIIATLKVYEQRNS